jgi:hypothetical protein
MHYNVVPEGGDLKLAAFERAQDRGAAGRPREQLAKNTQRLADDEERRRLHAAAAKWIGSIREGLQAVLTIEQTDFSVYRINGRRRFQVFPAERPELSK